MCTGQLYRIAPIFSRYGNYIQPEDRKYTIQHGARLEKLRITGNYEIQPIPCGYCVECRMQKAQEWAFRCMKEAEEHEHNWMITITYDDEHIPKVKHVDPETGEITETTTLKKEDVQKFRKDVQSYFNYHFKHTGIRYKLCGEYGSDKEYKDVHGKKRKATERPHYHILFFNIPIPAEDIKFHKWSYCEWSKEKNALYKSKILNKLWNKGWVDINEVNYETCCYVSRYILKKQMGKQGEEEYTKKGRIAPFTMQSLKPGLGHSYFEKNKEKFENEETFWQRTKKGLREFKPGRYFDKQIEKENPELMEAIKQKRVEKSQERWKDLLSKTGLTKEEYITSLVSKRENKVRFLKRTLI